MRNTQDLLRELDESVSKHQHVVMAVAFESGNAILIWPDDPERQRHLDEAVGLSGIPLGLIAVDYANGERIISTRVFPEYPEAGAARILDDLAVNMGQQIRH
jgi:hypothetical protein